MSKYHADCTKPTTHHEVNKSKCNQPKLTSKPFCDCSYCMCKDCPDILKMFSINVTENSCDFGPKVGKDKINNETEKSEETVQEIANLLENLDQDRACGCEVVARAVGSDIHRNLGLSELRAATHSENTTTKEPK
ncbi:uncharacterized protein LOC119189782 [Manduca sexta]|uniref:uncharacterized protein LOC119189782 n=1 Tax=Manduca sexta TaxID=7130 RepID=UPI00188E7203|nr:uncharacterized protein LOC119189782 [Manduca sexta]